MEPWVLAFCSLVDLSGGRGKTSVKQRYRQWRILMGNNLARMFHESPAATADMTVLPCH